MARSWTSGRKGPRLQFVRENENHPCAAIHFALDPGRAAVKIDNRFHQGQAQARAARTARRVSAVKTIEDMRQMLRRYSGPAVADCYFGMPSLCDDRY